MTDNTSKSSSTPSFTHNSEKWDAILRRSEKSTTRAAETLWLAMSIQAYACGEAHLLCCESDTPLKECDDARQRELDATLTQHEQAMDTLKQNAIQRKKKNRLLKSLDRQRDEARYHCQLKYALNKDSSGEDIRTMGDQRIECVKYLLAPLNLKMDELMKE